MKVDKEMLSIYEGGANGELLLVNSRRDTCCESGPVPASNECNGCLKGVFRLQRIAVLRLQLVDKVVKLGNDLPVEIEHLGTH